jgi:aspartyl-tRNA(Asn)/glutamyl-tRNA(Gln) amidotransferase subunit C
MIQKIGREEVRHVARLARLEFSDQDVERLTGQINSILNYMDKLNELDTSGVVPMTHAIRLQNVFRYDEVRPSLEREQALTNAPATDGVHFVVPKVI